MQINILFVLLIFITVILVAKNTNLLTATLVIASIVNLLVYLASGHSDIIKMVIRPTNLNKCSSGLVPDLPTNENNETHKVPEPNESNEPNDNQTPYGKYYDTHQAYNDLLSAPAQLPVMTSCSERTTGADSECALMAQHRTRDKRVLDAVATKTADYFAYNYAEELDQAESRVWWGQNDF